MRSRTPLLVAGLLALAAPRARAQDNPAVGDLADILAVEDRREFDSGLFQRAARHPDAIVRARAAMAMGRIRDHAAVQVLLLLLVDRDTSVRVEAAFALGLVGDRAAVAELTRQLESLPNESQGPWPKEIVTALCRLGGPEADEALIRLLQRHPAGITGDAAGDNATATALLEAWRMDSTSGLAERLPDYARLATGDWRRNAVYSAGRLRLSAALDPLLAAVVDPDPLTRAWALRGLTPAMAAAEGLGPDVLLTRIRPLLNDPDAQVRINALRAEAAFADSTEVPFVMARLIDRDLNVPVQAATTLGALGGSRAVAALRERMASPATWGLRRAIVLALAQAAPDTALAVAAPFRTDADWRTRLLYAEVVQAAQTPAARALAFALADDPDGRVAAAGLAAAGRAAAAGDSALVALARARLAHPDVIVRATAVGLLGRERSARYIPDLVAAYRRAELDALDDARLAAVDALARTASAGDTERDAVYRDFFGRIPRSSSYLVRRAVASRFGADVHRRFWGAMLPVETTRSAEDYRDAVRRYILHTTPAGPLRFVIETDRGDLVVELHAADAPLTADHLIRLVDRRYFDGGRWHRVVPNFVVQDGDPRGDGNGAPGTTVRDEINRWRYDRGVVGMALSGPDTGGSQFFITHSPQPHLDGGYTVFGHVVAGSLVLDQIVQGDRIRRIYRQ